MSYMKELKKQRQMYKELITRYTTLQLVERSIALVRGMDLLKEEGLVKIREVVHERGALETAHPWLKEI
jgi:hypothetical protein